MTARRGASLRQVVELLLLGERRLDQRAVLGARPGNELGQAVIALRADDEVDGRHAAHDLGAFGLGHAADDRDHRVVAGGGALVLQVADAPEIGIDLFDRLLADVAGVENDEIGFLDGIRFAHSPAPTAPRSCARNHRRSSDSRTCARTPCARPTARAAARRMRPPLRCRQSPPLRSSADRPSTRVPKAHLPGAPRQPYRARLCPALQEGRQITSTFAPARRRPASSPTGRLRGATMVTASSGRPPAQDAHDALAHLCFAMPRQLLAVGEARQAAPAARCGSRHRAARPSAAPRHGCAFPCRRTRRLPGAPRAQAECRAAACRRRRRVCTTASCAARLPPEGFAAANSEVMNGSTRLPSLEVPSANSTTVSPCASRVSDFTRRLPDGRAPRAIDEHRALQSRQRGDERPGADLLLGDERHRRHGRQHRDVEPRRVIGDEQHRPVARNRAVDVNADAEQAADLAMVPMRKGARAAGPKRSSSACTRHQRHGQGEERRQHRPAAQGADALCRSWRVTLSSPASRAPRKAPVDDRRA